MLNSESSGFVIYGILVWVVSIIIGDIIQVSGIIDTLTSGIKTLLGIFFCISMVWFVWSFVRFR